MDGIILSYTRGQVNAESLLREVHAAEERLILQASATHFGGDPPGG